jgi:hypothetical protein
VILPLRCRACSSKEASRSRPHGKDHFVVVMTSTKSLENVSRIRLHSSSYWISTARGLRHQKLLCASMYATCYFAASRRLVVGGLRLRARRVSLLRCDATRLTRLPFSSDHQRFRRTAKSFSTLYPEQSSERATNSSSLPPPVSSSIYLFKYVGPH